MIELYVLNGMVDGNASVSITCALRWGVALVGVISARRGSPYMGKYFKCGTDMGGRHSIEAIIVKKADMRLLLTFLSNVLEQSSFNFSSYVRGL